MHSRERGGRERETELAGRGLVSRADAGFAAAARQGAQRAPRPNAAATRPERAARSDSDLTSAARQSPVSLTGGAGSGPATVADRLREIHSSFAALRSRPAPPPAADPGP